MNELKQNVVDIDFKIWRYMNFTKFVDVLDKRALYFTRLDKLDDKFEGSYPKKYLDKQNEIFKKANYNSKDFNPIAIIPQRKNLKKYFAVNCWHINDYESAAMWKLYTSNNEGIAIQSTKLSLGHSFAKSKESVWLVPVQYIDYDEDLPQLGPWGIVRLKRKSFEFEKELRVLIQKIPGDHQDLIKGRKTIGDGILVNTNLEILINCIYVSPSSPKWFYDLVKSVTTKYKINKPVIQSQISGASPLY